VSDGRRTGESTQAAPLDVEPGRVGEWLDGGAEVQLIDVREPYEREAGYIGGSRHIELPTLAQHAGSIDRERVVVVYCRVGSRSTMAAQALRSAGYEAYSLAGGIVRWVGEGHPLEPENGYVADH
jgi:rhodanese-related sulfurtransferase